MPLCSVLLPSYNHEKYLEEAINSVINQTEEDWELIIIDDASQDNSPLILDKFQKDDRIHIKRHDKNRGIASTLNQALKCSKGDFVAFIASDDVWHPRKLEEQLEILKKDDEQIVWSEGLILNDKSEATGEKFTQIYKSSPESGYIFPKLLQGNFIFGSSLILKKSLLDGLEFDTQLRFLNDHKLYLDLAFKYKFYFIPEALAGYRIHGANTTFNDLSTWYQDSMKLSSYISREYPRKRSLISKKSLFDLCCVNPLYHGLKVNPKNKVNLYYLIVLPLWYLYILIS
ncbi:MAG: hypothetical protein CIT03_07695 [Methanobacterium sp.]|nr:MAG: hypothetical protein CIT03_07695 [Methanobacterium sp.]